MTSYRIIIRQISNDGDRHLSCGIAVYQGDVLIRTAEDLSRDAEAVARLAALFNDEDLDPVHFDQAIEDFLYDFTV